MSIALAHQINPGFFFFNKELQLYKTKAADIKVFSMTTPSYQTYLLTVK
jgi:hypothetical protein